MTKFQAPEVHDLMEVVRVKTERGSHIEPALDESWTELDKLRWNAGVLKADTGVVIRIAEHANGNFSVSYKTPENQKDRTVSGGSAASDYDTIYRKISDMHFGIEIAQRQGR